MVTLRQGLEGFTIELIETDYAVYVIIKVRDLIVIAVRGTVPLYYYDLRADLNIRKVLFDSGSRRGFFHKGFYDEVVATGPRLTAALQKLGASTEDPNHAPKIYVTGHSLGGAIAAILHGLWVFDDEGAWLRPPFNISPSDTFICHSAYTFGMPKFANAEIIQSFRRLYHVRNRHDPVPCLPPGFAHDETQEIVLESHRGLQTDPVKAFAIILWLNSVGRARMLKNHGIETYWVKLAEDVGVEVPDRLMPPDPSLFKLIPYTFPHRP
jgi:Lipase (class 3)